MTLCRLRCLHFVHRTTYCNCIPIRIILSAIVILDRTLILFFLASHFKDSNSNESQLSLFTGTLLQLPSCPFKLFTFLDLPTIFIPPLPSPLMATNTYPPTKTNAVQLFAVIFCYFRPFPVIFSRPCSMKVFVTPHQIRARGQCTLKATTTSQLLRAPSDKRSVLLKEHEKVRSRRSLSGY